ncbi:hypothetical protein HOC_04357 [Hyphomonas oceanitis SCH89]|uniref:Uncharacterized protein n=1 Tax=Hyphomonas oceanitis SCH89 TaxID=1280953 RepID=A0A059G9Z8_9PROT|nr:hypothetical protein HOC_04357 [Hyphomonas oceanitis SCH89]
MAGACWIGGRAKCGIGGRPRANHWSRPAQHFAGHMPDARSTPDGAAGNVWHLQEAVQIAALAGDSPLPCYAAP